VDVTSHDAQRIIDKNKRKNMRWITGFLPDSPAPLGPLLKDTHLRDRKDKRYDIYFVYLEGELEGGFDFFCSVALPDLRPNPAVPVERDVRDG
jgi:hypothetical protein